jgi:hypothetical protein
MVGGAEQDGLGFQRHACFPGLKDSLGHVPGLGPFERTTFGGPPGNKIENGA